MRLQGIAAIVFVAGSILLAAVAVGLSVGFLVALTRFERVRQRRAAARIAFQKRLLRGVARRRIQDLGDVQDSYRAFFGVNVLRGSHLEEIAELLEGAVLLSDSMPPGRLQGWSQSSAHSVRELLLANQRALAVEFGYRPFSGTPEPERRILRELLEPPVGANGTAASRLHALAKAIRIRQDMVERLSRERGRCLRWARWGWYGTLAFAIAATILGIMYLG